MPSNSYAAKKQLPPLETVDERSLTAEIWAASAHQRPQRQLNGIKADNLEEKHRMMGITRGSPSSRPTSPTIRSPPPTDSRRPVLPYNTSNSSTIDETMFNESNDYDAKPYRPAQDSARSGLASKHPKRHSSLTALNQHSQGSLSRERPTFYESNSSGESDAVSEETPYASPGTRDISPPLDSVLEESDALSMNRSSYKVDPPNQPLPPIPAQQALRPNPIISPGSSRPSDTSLLDPTLSKQRPPSAKSKRSSQLTSPTHSKSGSISSSSHDTRRANVMSDATWEDDVDYLYEQEAEATCDFDWQGANPAQDSSITESDGGVRLSTWIAPSPAPNIDNPNVLTLNHSSDDIVKVPAITESQGQHRRGSSVGHRGFLAARRGSTELSRKTSTVPPVLELTPTSTQVSILSPVFSVTGADDETPKTPYTPAVVPFRGFSDAGRASGEYLSDPESVLTGGSKHRKSSSYGSYESVARPNPSYVNRETARWSLASSSHSVPDLLHSRRKSRSSLHKSIISRPLESLPQSPDKPTDFDHVDGKESIIVPRASQIEPMRNTFVVRRPETIGDRAASQVASRAVHRGRSATPNRFSRLLPPSEAGGSIEHDDSGGWI